MSRDEESLERLTLRLPPRTAAAVGRGTISLDGFRSDRVISECVRRTGSWEPAIMEVIVEKLPEGGTFIDVGANIGIHSMVAVLRVGSHGRVLAVEASPVTYPLLEKNLAATGHPGVTTLHQAVWDQDAALAFCHQPNAPGGSHVGAGDGDAFLVPGRPLDDLVDAHGVTRVDVIKLDIEGAEMKALLGSQKTLQDKRPTPRKLSSHTHRLRYSATASKLHFAVPGQPRRCLEVGRTASGYIEQGKGALAPFP